MDPRYPVYVVSKGRWESRLTSRFLEKAAVPYRIVVEHCPGCGEDGGSTVSSTTQA